MTDQEPGAPSRAGIRRAELVALLSLGTDLGLGQPMEHMIRACLIALRLGEQLGLSEEDRAVVYYSGLLAWVGCHTDAYEQAKWFGDDIYSRSDAHYEFDMGKVGPVLAFLTRHVGGQSRPLAERARAGVAFIAEGRRDLLAMAQNHYHATDLLASRLGLGDDVRESLRETYERWDGKGAFELRGEEITTASRLINLADVVEVFGRAGGVEAAVAVARDRSGGQFDPALVDTFCELAPILLSEVDATPSWDAVIASEPRSRELDRRGRPRRGAGGGGRVCGAQVPVDDGARPRSCGAERTWPRSISACRTQTSRSYAGPASCRTSGDSACPTRSGTSPDRCPTRRSSASACTRT